MSLHALRYASKSLCGPDKGDRSNREGKAKAKGKGGAIVATPHTADQRVLASDRAAGKICGWATVQHLDFLYYWIGVRIDCSKEPILKMGAGRICKTSRSDHRDCSPGDKPNRDTEYEFFERRNHAED